MPLISDKDAEFLRKEFEMNLVEPVKLVMFTQEMECQFCAETRQIVEEISELSDKIAVVIYDFTADKAAIEAVLGEQFGTVRAVDTTDGLRITFESGEIAHLRPSGNAPELRAYTEADTAERAAGMNRICMEVLAGWR